MNLFTFVHPRVNLPQMCNKNTAPINMRLNTSTVTGSLWYSKYNDDDDKSNIEKTCTLRPGESSVYILIIAAVEPPALRATAGELDGPLPEPRLRLNVLRIMKNNYL